MTVSIDARGGSRKMSNFQRTMEGVLAAGISAALSLGYIIFVGRSLGPVGYADFSASLSLIYLLTVTLTPISPTLSRIVAALNAREEWASIRGVRKDVMRRAVVWLAGLCVVALSTSPLIASALRFRSAVPVSLSVLAAAGFVLLSIDRGVLQGLMRFRQYNLNTVIESLLRFGGTILLFYTFQSSTNAALASYVAAIAVAEIMLAVWFRREWRRSEVRPADWKQIKRLGLPMLGLMICVAIFQNADMLAVKRWLTPEQSGLYGAAAALARGFGVAFVPLYILSGPILSALHESRKPLAGTILRYQAGFVALAAVPLVICAVWPEAVLTILYGGGFVGAAPLLLPLAGLSVITLSALLLAQLLITVHDFRFLVVYVCMSAVQVAGLFVFHQSTTQVLAVLYVCQGIVLIAIVGMILLRVRDVRS